MPFGYFWRFVSKHYAVQWPWSVTFHPKLVHMRYTKLWHVTDWRTDEQTEYKYIMWLRHNKIVDYCPAGHVLWSRDAGRATIMQCCRVGAIILRDDRRRESKLLNGDASLTRSFDCDCAQVAHAHRRSASHCFRLRHLCCGRDRLGGITDGMVSVLPFTDDNRLSASVTAAPSSNKA